MRMKFLSFVQATAVVAFMFGPQWAQADDFTDTLVTSIPPPLEGWVVQIDHKVAHGEGVKAFGIYTTPDKSRLFVIEVDAGGTIVSTIASAWDHQLLIAEVVEIAGHPFTVESGELTALIEKKVLIRAYSPDTDEQEVIELHLDGLDIDALVNLAKQMP